MEIFGNENLINLIEIEIKIHIKVKQQHGQWAFKVMQNSKKAISSSLQTESFNKIKVKLHFLLKNKNDFI